MFAQGPERLLQGLGRRISRLIFLSSSMSDSWLLLGRGLAIVSISAPEQRKGGAGGGAEGY